MTINKHSLFVCFKYTVYVLLTFNIWAFYQEEALASQELFASGLSFDQIILAYSSTIDTAAWVVLIWLFELETAVISDEKLKGPLRLGLMSVRVICYGFILYALSGYSAKLIMFLSAQPFSAGDVCQLVGQNVTYILDLDEYPAISAEMCQTLNGSPLFTLPNTQIIGTAEALQSATWLAWIDVINATAWVLVIITLEVEVFLQLRHALAKRKFSLLSSVKAVLYLTLLLCAIYWGLMGDFIDFWDAFLWLVAFVFIELNIFNWNQETRKDTELSSSYTQV